MKHTITTSRHIQVTFFQDSSLDVANWQQATHTTPPHQCIRRFLICYDTLAMSCQCFARSEVQKWIVSNCRVFYSFIGGFRTTQPVIPIHPGTETKIAWVRLYCAPTPTRLNFACSTFHIFSHFTLFQRSIFHQTCCRAVAFHCEGRQGTKQTEPTEPRETELVLGDRSRS